MGWGGAAMPDVRAGGLCLRSSGRCAWRAPAAQRAASAGTTYGHSSCYLAMLGVPLKVIQELMGYVTIQMTECYAHQSPDTRRKVVRVLDRSFALACDIRATRLKDAANDP